MEQVIGGIKALARAILDDTKVEAERIVAGAQNAAHRVLAQAKEESAALRADILAQAEGVAAHLEQQAMATSRLEAQRVMLGRREELFDKVFDLAAERLARLYQEEEYPRILGALLVDAAERLSEPSECVVRVAAGDLPLLTGDLMGEAAGRWRGRVHLAIGEPVEISGGVIVETPDGRKRYDNSLEARLAQARARLRADVFRLLRGQS